MRQRGRLMRLPTAQNGRRNSAQGLPRPLCACLVRAVWEILYTVRAVWEILYTDWVVWEISYAVRAVWEILYAVWAVWCAGEGKSDVRTKTFKHGYVQPVLSTHMWCA